MTYLNDQDLLDDSQSRSELTALVKDNMAISAWWTRFLGGMGLFFSAIAAFFYILLIAESFSKSGVMMGLILALVTVLTLGIGAYLCYLLYQYGTQLKALAADDPKSSFGEFLQVQKKFWRLIGVLALFMIGLYTALIFFSLFGLVGASDF